MSRVNLCTNPRAGGGATTGWTPVGLSTFEAVTLDGATHPDPLVLPDGTVVDTALHCITTDAASSDQAMFAFAVAAGDYRAAVYVWQDATALELQLYDGTSILDSAISSGPGSWERLDVSSTAPGADTWTTWVKERGGSGTVEWYLTAVLVEQAGSLGSYGDGDMSGWRWAGTPHASVSIFDGSPNVMCNRVDGLAELGGKLIGGRR